MAKRLKKVNIPKDAPKGPFTPPTAPAVLQPAAFTAPSEPSEWAKRVQARVMAVRVKLAQQKAAQPPKKAPPFDPETLTSETIVAGKPVKAWFTEIEERSLDAAKGTLDLRDMPDWSVWAVNRWVAMGKPTPPTKVLAEVITLREEAEKLLKFSGMDKDKAGRQNGKKAVKLLEAAEKKSIKAAALFQEATKLANDHMKK